MEERGGSGVQSTNVEFDLVLQAPTVREIVECNLCLAGSGQHVRKLTETS
eukprot:m.114429 g.114429  ORF g.114429 m.114429 type:complete len:50 (+) comp13052_c1_seq2:62-211(+)